MIVRASILIPVYNERASFLEQCIVSAVQQTCQDVEVVVSDNHSDLRETKDAIYRLARIYPFIRVVSPSSHVPMFSNFRYVYQCAKGEWVTFLCSDDFLEPTFIEESLNGIRGCLSPPAFSYCRTSFYSEEQSSIVAHVKSRRPGWASRDQTIRRFLSGKEGSFCGLLIRSNFLKGFDPFPNWLNYCGDLYIETCLSRYAGSCFINKPLAICRLHKRDEQDNRLPQYIKDVGTIYKFYETDSLLTSRVGSAYIRKQRYLLLASSIYSYVNHRRKQSLGSSLLDEAKAQILFLDSSILTRLLLLSHRRIILTLLMRVRTLAALLPARFF